MCDKHYLGDAEYDTENEWIGYKDERKKSSTFTLIEQQVPQ